MTGLTAYFGLLDIGKPKAGTLRRPPITRQRAVTLTCASAASWCWTSKPGETVLVSGAAGATGSVAGQIAKIKVSGRRPGHRRLQTQLTETSDAH